MKTRRTRRPGFTLVELLVVMVIVLLLTAIGLPLVLTATEDQQVKGAVQSVQAALAATKDQVRSSSTVPIVGVRLVHEGDLAVDSDTGAIATDQPLMYSRIVPLYQPRDYAIGRVSVPTNGYPAGYPASFLATLPPLFATARHPLIVEDAVVDGSATPTSPDGNKSEPANWFWNIRVGDRMTIAGHNFTVCGPMVVLPGDGNSEGFVNVGPPGTLSPLQRTYTINGNDVAFNIDFLFLTDGQDDVEPSTGKPNGFIDDGWDGVDNNLDIVVVGGQVDEAAEWEVEKFPPQLQGGFAARPYTISRRPMPAKEGAFSLPSDMVIDATNWAVEPVWHNEASWHDRYGDPQAGPDWDYSAIRSRLPVNRYTGDVDIVFSTNGGVSTTSFYGVPPRQRFGEDFYHFWITSRANAIYNVLATYDAPDGSVQTNVLEKPKRPAGIVSINLKNGRIITGDAANDAAGTKGTFLRQIQ